MAWEFKCLECGDCCKNLRVIKRKGLLLKPNEIVLFPHDHIEPCLGKGKSPNHPKFVIWAFQLIDDNCPHLFESRCKIYENRPDFCREYPYRMISRTATGDFNMVLAPECRAFKKVIDSKKYQENVEESDESEMAKMNGFWMLDFQKWKKKDDTPWVYNLVTKEWEIYRAKEWSTNNQEDNIMSEPR